MSKELKITLGIIISAILLVIFLCHYLPKKYCESEGDITEVKTMYSFGECYHQVNNKWYKETEYEVLHDIMMTKEMIK